MNTNLFTCKSVEHILFHSMRHLLRVVGNRKRAFLHERSQATSARFSTGYAKSGSNFRWTVPEYCKRSIGVRLHYTSGFIADFHAVFANFLNHSVLLAWCTALTSSWLANISSATSGSRCDLKHVCWKRVTSATNGRLPKFKVIGL
jgi:hypothetical protein